MLQAAERCKRWKEIARMRHWKAAEAAFEQSGKGRLADWSQFERQCRFQVRAEDRALMWARKKAS